MSLRFNAEAYNKLYPRKKPEAPIESACEKFSEISAAEPSEVETDNYEEPEEEGGEVEDGMGTACESIP